MKRSSSALTRELTKLKLDMLTYDGIHYEPPNPNGGAKGRTLYFCKVKNNENPQLYI